MICDALKYLCIYFLIGSTTGRTIDLEYGYQEIEAEPSNLEKDGIPEETIRALQRMCGNSKVIIQRKLGELHVDCDEARAIQLVKRDAAESDIGEEGSGDTDNQTEKATEQSTNDIEQNETTEISHDIETSSTVSQNIPITSEETNKQNNGTGNPVMFQNGFHNILMNMRVDQPVVPEEVEKKEDIQLKPQVEETIEAAESKETASASSPNSVFLLVLAGLGVIGTLALAFNYVKKKREEKEVVEVMQLEQDGKELKEMKPLMKSPLTQNGARSLEYIDAEPQNEIREV